MVVPAGKPEGQRKHAFALRHQFRGRCCCNCCYSVTSVGQDQVTLWGTQGPSVRSSLQEGLSSFSEKLNTKEPVAELREEDIYWLS